MKKKIFAAVTAAALSASMLNVLPADAVTYQEATVDYGNFVHIDVIDSSNEPVGVNMKLMDSDGICVAKFAGDGSDGDPWNNSEIGFDPASTDNTRYEVGWADAEKYVPDGYKLLYKNERTEGESGINLLHEGETEEVMIHYIPEEEPETDLTVPANTIAFYADPTIKWQEIGGDPISMFIPYEDFARASGAENAFGIKVPGWLSAQKSPVCFTAGETQDITLYLKDAEQEADLTLPAGYYGLYTDPKWADDSSDCTSYLYVGDEPVYLNPEDGSGNYGGISTYYTAESIGPAIYAGLCARAAEPEQMQFITKPEISTEATEFVKHRMHVSQISEDFRDDGRYLYKDWVIDPRCNTEENGCIIFIKSEGFVNVVLPDEEGYVEFYAEKEERYCQMYAFYNFSANSSSTTRVDQTGIVAADSFTDYYTAVSLPDTGVVLTNVPEREYILSFTSVPEEYIKPENMTLNIENELGIQTVEIILEDKFTLGDADCDGDIDLNDAVLVLTHYAGVSAELEPKLSDAQLAAADVNADGNVNLADASAILSYYSKQASGLKPQW